MWVPAPIPDFDVNGKPVYRFIWEPSQLRAAILRARWRADRDAEKRTAHAEGIVKNLDP